MMNFICDDCKGGFHETCEAVRRGGKTWCDCQHVEK